MFADEWVEIQCQGLKACPFCGSVDVHLRLLCHEDGDTFAVDCEDCMASGPICEVANVAYQAWNNRENQCEPTTRPTA